MADPRKKLHCAIDEELLKLGQTSAEMIARTYYGKFGMNFEERANWMLTDYVAHAASSQR